jgi:signal transduction histidine kinase
MKLTKKQAQEVLKIYSTGWEAYLRGDLKTHASCLSSKFKIIGTTEAEHFNSKKAWLAFCKKTMHQVAGVAQLRNRKIKLDAVGDGVMVVENAAIYVLMEDKWQFYSKIRITALLQKEKTGWKYVHQHGSLPDMRASEDETLATKQIKKENQQLREAVKRRTIELEEKNRELEIEAALERVRAVAMGMKKPEDMLAVCCVISDQLQQFGIANIRNVQIVIIDENIGQYLCYQYFAPYNKTAVEKSEYLKSPVEHEMVKRMLASRDGHFIGSVKGKEFTKFRKHRKTEKHFPDPLLDKAKEIGHIFLSIGEGGLGLSLYGAWDESVLNLFKRFHQVFMLAYQRFRDIQKAEAQVREAQIEAALEKVRSRSLAMHKSEELQEVVSVVFNKLMELGFNLERGAAIINIFNEGEKDHLQWIADPTQAYAKCIKMMHHENALLQDVWTARQEGVEFYSRPYNKEEKNSFFKHAFSNTDYRLIPDELKEILLASDHYSFSISFQKHSGIGIADATGRLFNDEEKSILIRFAKVFEQAYIRFLDLQKAEAQAREAQIEAALEKVRSRAMAMQKSVELLQVIKTLSEQLRHLGLRAEAVSFLTDGDERGYNMWLSSPGEAFLSKIFVPRIQDRTTLLFQEAKETGKRYYSYVLSKEEKDIYFQNFFDNTVLKDYPDNGKEQVYAAPGMTTTNVLLDTIVLSVSNFDTLPFSDQENEIINRIGFVFQQTYTRFLDLQKAEAQAREAKIEAALERVRAQAMAMHQSEDLGETITVYYEQLDGLIDSTIVRCGAGLLNKENTIAEMSSASKSPEGETFHVKGTIDMRGHPLLDNTYEHWLNQKEYHHVLRGNAIKEYYQYITNQVAVPENKGNDELYFYFPMFTEGSFYVVTSKAVPEDELQIFRRFSSVLSLTYRRFNDLQKAEAQAREAQIEVALERVRSKTLAMHNSQDVGEAIGTLFDELLKLGVDKSIRCGVGIMTDSDFMEVWAVTSISTGNVDLIKGKLNMTIHPLLVGVKNAWKNKEQTFSYELIGQDLIEYYRALNDSHEYPIHVDLETLPKKIIHNSYYFPEGILFSFTSDQIPEAATQVFLRFAGVFGHTYRRFLDLQKAEAQAREAKIEAALERVRSRTMGMQSSEELPDVANLLFLEVQGLGIPAWSCGYNILSDDGGSSTCIMSSEGIMQKPFTLPLTGEASFLEWHSFIQSEETFITQELGGRAIAEHYDFMKSLPHLASVFKELEEAGLSLPTYQINHLCKFAQGFLLFITYEKVPESYDIFKRFTKVFEQTYTRFLDLKKAEAQATEATRQASLDRVRGEIASMRTADDLQRITPLVWRELVTLGVPFFRCGVFIINENDQCIHAYLSTPEGKSLAVLRLPYDSNDTNRNAVEHWREQKVYTDHWDRQQFQSWAKAMMEQQQIEGEQQYQAGEAPPESLSLQFIPFKQGMLYVGSSEPLAEDHINLVKSLADAFSVAYARYEDFKQLEDAKNRVEATLTELRATQTQLIQAEKMASLGELTAGIAHEIQNPLNFVNNFSEVNKELLAELNEELKKNNLDEVRAIARDVIENEEKIVHHGKRADAIVKGMLQHSRASSGTKELTDLDALADEYLRLAYHGLRAKDKTFNAKFETHFDESIGKIEVVPQDIGRVILNLITNAFYAVTEKKKSIDQSGLKNLTGLEAYEPTVSISTRKSDGTVLISVKDNGNGIPDSIKGKIFQPFFTTKPTGQGTGLGLSLSYDIVKAHGGELRVETREGEGTRFIIQLPCNS